MECRNASGEVLANERVDSRGQPVGSGVDGPRVCVVVQCVERWVSPRGDGEVVAQESIGKFEDRNAALAREFEETDSTGARLAQSVAEPASHTRVVKKDHLRIVTFGGGLNAVEVAGEMGFVDMEKAGDLDDDDVEARARRNVLLDEFSGLVEQQPADDAAPELDTDTIQVTE